MPILHIINKSPAMRSSLESCLRVAQKDSAIILIEDAVIAAINNTHTEILSNKSIKIFVLEPDLKARGIKPDQLAQSIEPVDYNRFVNLTVEYDGVQSWS